MNGIKRMKLLLIRRENVCYSLFDCLLDGLEGGLLACGIKPDMLDVSSNPLIQPDESVLRDIANRGYDAVLTFNAVGQQNYMFDGKNLWDSMNVPFVNYIVDHPLQHNTALSDHCKNYVVICVDKTHVDFVEKYYPDIREKAFFLPLGCVEGRNSNSDIDTIDNFRDRNIDILFTGTYLPLSSIENKINEYPPAVRRLIVRHIEYMLSNRSQTEEEGLKHVLNDMGIDESDVDFKGYLIATKLTEEYVRAYIREEIIRYLIDSELSIRIFGNGWDLFDDDMKNAISYPGVPYAKLFELYEDSKIVLDQSSHFRFGMHDRIPSALLAGAGVLTDRNNYLKETFAEGLKEGELCMYNSSRPQEVPEIAKNMLSDIDGLFAMSLRGKKAARSRLTWETRASELVDVLNSVQIS